MSEVFNRYIKQLANTKHKSENTVMSYMRDILLYANFLEGCNKELENSDSSDVLLFINELNNNKKASSTISRNIISLRSFFNYALEEGAISKNPMDNIDIPKINKQLPKVLSVEEMEKLLAQPDLSTEKGIRDKAMLEILYASGIKISELTELKVTDINLSLGYLKCMESSRSRIIPLGKQAVISTGYYIENARDKLNKNKKNNNLFLNMNGNEMTRQGFWKILKKYATDAGIEKKLPPNIIRHTFAAHLIENGADLRSVQEMMGYANISATHVYIELTKSRLNDVYKKAHPRA